MIEMSCNDVKRGGTTFNRVGGGPQHGRGASGEGAPRSASSNFPEPEVVQQASGENEASARNPELVVGHPSRENNPIGQNRAPKPSSTPLMPTGSSGARKKNQKNKPKNQALPDLYSLFGPQSHQWDRYLAIRFKDDDMNDLEFEKHIIRITRDKEITFHTDRSNNKIIKTKDSLTSERLQELQQLGELPVEITPHKTLNSRKGTILCNHLRLKDTPFTSAGPSIKESLEARGHQIEEVMTYEIPSRSRRTNLRLARVTFHTQSLPEKVTVGGVSLAVKEYIPKPMQCKNCWRYRHPSKYCANPITCVKCGQTGHSNPHCENDPKCTNCEIPHHANSRECVHFKYHSTITMMWENMGLPFREAKNRIKEEGLFPDLTYAGAARKHQLAQQIKNPPQKQRPKPQENRHRISNDNTELANDLMTQKNQIQQQQQPQREKEQESEETLDDTFLSAPDIGETTLLAAEEKKPWLHQTQQKY